MDLRHEAGAEVHCTMDMSDIVSGQQVGGTKVRVLP